MTAKNSDETHQPENVLVTGGGGFLGEAIVKRLVTRGDQVRSLSRKKYPALEAMGVEQIPGDISDPAIVARACEAVEIVYHVAAKPPPWGKYHDYYQTNVVGTENVIAGCYRHNVARLIYTSTPSVVFDGTDKQGADESLPYPVKFNAHYPATKALAEQKVINAAAYGLGTVALRPHQIWGPGDPHFVPRLIARAGELKQIGSGKNLVDTTYIDNAADAHLLAADRLAQNPAISGNTYFISQDDPVPVWDMINAILQAAGLEPISGRVPYRAAWTVGAVLEFFYRTFHLAGEPKMTRFLADAVAKSHWFDIRAAKQDLGYSPLISTEEGLQRLAAWLENK
ncbi:MAG: NAD-dependent epimerase/dehydratase family protein [Desulfobacterales bacterium]